MIIIEHGGTVHRNFTRRHERWINWYMKAKIPFRIQLFIKYHSPRMNHFVLTGEYDYNLPMWTKRVQGVKPWWLRFNPKAFMDYKPEEVLPRHEIQWGEWHYDN